jgi:lipoyl(octanoyl) transferase
MSQVREPNRSSSEIWVCHLGVVPYARALAMQEQVRSLRQAGELPDSLLLLEHPAVYTRGRRAAASDLPLGEAFYRERGIDVIDVDRGGRVTFHAPGQLVGYPIMAAPDVVRHVRTIESAIVDALGQRAVHCRARPEDGPDYTGVWVQNRKIASIGVHIQRGVSTHGFAINVHNELEPFSWVLACGLPDVTMTSLEREHEISGAGRGDCAREMRCVRRLTADAFARAHSLRQRLVPARALGIETGAAHPERELVSA